MVIPNVPLPQGISAGGSPRCQKAMGGSIAQTRSEKVPTLPRDSPLPRVHTLGSDEGSMTLQELKVKKLEKIVNRSHSRRRAKIVVSDDEEALEDSSKQGRIIEEIDEDARVALVTPTHGEDQLEDQLGVLSATKVLADAAKTYTRRRREVSTGSGGISTASRLFSTAKESVSTAGASMPVSTAESELPKKIKKKVQIQMSLDEELAQKLHEEEQARFNAEQEVKINAEQEELLASEV
ncbi:hypothetical protein Tco_1338973, partial [Tanacetum coccineum]